MDSHASAGGCQVKPTQDDVERARILIGTWLRDRNPKGLTDRCAQALADAREREREACARLADKAMLVPSDGGAPTTDEVNMCECIAASIRARGAEKEQADEHV